MWKIEAPPVEIIPQQNSKALQGLPPKFVSAMRTLFDVLDDNKTGYISLTDIESRWCPDQDEGGGVAAVPPGVIDSLRKVTPASGELSFERFCAGLKICLLRSKAERSHDTSSQSNDNMSENEDQSARVSILRHHRLLGNPSPALSLPPRLDPPPLHVAGSPGPPKPPRYPFMDQSNRRRLGDGGAASDGELDQQRARLKKHQLLSEPAITTTQRERDHQQPSQTSSEQQHDNARKQPRRRESHSRRHTLQNGIDYGLLKRMKAIEEERDALLKGLQTVEKAEQWYRDQLATVQERMRNIARTGGTRPETEITREKLVFQIARMDEVNQHLNSLITADMSFPLGMNLALGARGRPTQSANNKEMKEMERQIIRLKDQNKLLTEEVGKKSNAITVLDQEKGALIRELFQARSRVRQAEMNDPSGEATFM